MKNTYNSTRMQQENMYYCHLASSTFSSSSAGEVSVRWYRFGAELVVSSDKSFGLVTRRVQI